MSIADGSALEKENCLCISPMVSSNPGCPIHGERRREVQKDGGVMEYNRDDVKRLERELEESGSNRFDSYNFKMTPAPEPGALYRCDYTWFWKTLQYLTATLNAWVSDQAHKRAIYTKLRGPEDGIRIDHGREG